MIQKASELSFLGHYRNAFELLKSNMITDIDDPDYLDFYTELGSLALKLSLLDLSKDCVLESIKYINARGKEKYQKQLIQNVLTYCKISYWLCKYQESIETLNLLGEKGRTGEVLQHLANSYRAWCSYDQAEEAIGQALKLLPEEDKMVQSNIIFVQARLCMDTDRSVEGIELAKKCLEMRINYFGTEFHPEVAVAQELAGKLYFSMGDVNTASTYHNSAYQTKIRALGKFNFETIDSINERDNNIQCLFLFYEQKALKYFARLGEISLVLLGKVNQYQALSYNNLGCAFYNMKDYDKAIDHHVKALRLYEELCGKNHFKLIFSLNQMAHGHKQMKRYKAALELWSRCVVILENVKTSFQTKHLKIIMDGIESLKGFCED